MWIGASETKEMKLNKWLELSSKWSEMNKQMNKTPNMITAIMSDHCLKKRDHKVVEPLIELLN